MLKICSHFHICGGCKTQDISYEEELLRKQQFVAELFPSSLLLPILPCEHPFEYRNKMEFSFSQAKSGLRFCGLMASRGRVVNLEECFLASSWFTLVLGKVRTWWEESLLTAYYPPKNCGLIRNLTLREGKRTGEKMAILTLSGEPIDEMHLKTFVETLLASLPFDSIVLRRQITRKKMPTYFEESTLHGKNHIHEILYDEKGNALKFKIRASSFFQPNPLQAEKLIQKALSFINPSESEMLLDLYCGTATFGIFASKMVKKVIGIEINPDSIEDAHENLKLNSISNLRLILGNVSEVFPKDIVPDVVLIDPPRAGLCPEALGHLKALKPKVIIYVSCNPVTQARDVGELRCEGYVVRVIQPVDQFPRTPHVENIVVMDRPF